MPSASLYLDTASSNSFLWRWSFPSSRISAPIISLDQNFSTSCLTKTFVSKGLLIFWQHFLHVLDDESFIKHLRQNVWPQERVTGWRKTLSQIPQTKYDDDDALVPVTPKFFPGKWLKVAMMDSIKPYATCFNFSDDISPTVLKLSYKSSVSKTFPHFDRVSP